MMSRIRSKNTAPETRVRSAVHKLGIRFRNHASDLPGKPDLSNRRKRWVIFVHGCFWHGHLGCSLASKPRPNAAYWEPKLTGNIARDLAHYRNLEQLGFRVFIIWECETRRPKRLMGVVTAVRDHILRIPPKRRKTLNRGRGFPQRSADPAQLETQIDTIDTAVADSTAGAAPPSQGAQRGAG
jgi:DNA mismatch endonuclease (patch repair protein)